MKRSPVSNASHWRSRIWWRACDSARRAPSRWPWKARGPRIRARRIRRGPTASRQGIGTKPRRRTIGSSSRSNRARRNNLKGDPDNKFGTFGIEIEKPGLLGLRRDEAGAEDRVAQGEGYVRTQPV